MKAEHRRDIARTVIAQQTRTPALEQLALALAEHDAYRHQIVDGQCLWRLSQQAYAARQRQEALRADFLTNLLLLAFDLEDLWKIDAAYYGRFRNLPYSSGFVALDGSRYNTHELLAHPDPASLLTPASYALLGRLGRAIAFSELPTREGRLTQIMGHVIVHGSFNP